MRSLRYLNGILTVLAVLLAVNTWVLIAGSPAGAVLSPVTPAHAQGVGGAANRQVEVVDQLKALNKTATALEKAIAQGVNVNVKSLPKKSD